MPPAWEGSLPSWHQGGPLLTGAAASLSVHQRRTPASHLRFLETRTRCYGPWMSSYSLKIPVTLSTALHRPASIPYPNASTQDSAQQPRFSSF